LTNVIVYGILNKITKKEVEMLNLLRAMKKNTVIIQKPSGTIAIRVDLTAEQRKFYNGLLFVARESLRKDNSLRQYTIKLSELKQLLEKEKEDRNNDFYKTKIKELMHRIAEYNILQKDKTINGAFVLVPRIEFETNEITKEIIVRYELPEVIRERLINPQDGIFANIDLVVIRGLKSRYSIILYELVRDYKGTEIPEMDLQTFRKIFGIENKKAYKTIVNLKDRVLNPAIKELNSNENIDFLVNYELIRSGKTYTSIKFTVQPKKKQLIAEPKEPKIEIPIEPAIEPDSKIKQMMELIPETERTLLMRQYLTEVLQDYDYGYVTEQIRYTVEQNPKNLLAYLKTAIENDYAQVKKKQEQIENILQEKLQKLEKEKEKMIEVIIDEQKRKIFENYMAKLDPDDVLELRKKCIERIKKENKDIDQFLLNVKVKMMLQDIVLAQPECQEQLADAEKKAIEIAEKEYQIRKKKILLNGANDV
jgi:ssRNA-specific RNase YbeY (16S rRNA maturation enzyme)